MPPKSQKLPLLSVHVVAPWRAPGKFASAGVPNVPYTAEREKVTGPLPPIQVQRLVEGLNSQRSLSGLFRYPQDWVP